MAAFDDGNLSLDEDDTQTSRGRTASSKAETNASNNSSAQKKGDKQSSKSGRSQTSKKPSNQNVSQSQASRRKDLLDKLHSGIGYVYDSHTQAFLNFLSRTNSETRNVKSKVFKNQLMLPENMDEIPTSFAKNWLMVVAPVGSRCLVVASMGHTGAYSKTGYHIISHPSNLPMGNKTMQGYGSCVLDCIYCNEAETYFVLDMMCWDGQPLYDCETQVRFSQLQERIREYDLGRPSRQNPYPFVPLKTFTPTKSNICGAVKMAPYLIDGLLFYHKIATYKPGTTPLVLWLTLDRLPTKMKIEIPEMGIVTAVSYKDPVALALAHGVSPAIISQVYPTANPRNGRGHAPIQPRPFLSLPHGFSQRSFSQGSFSQGSQGFFGGNQMRRGLGPLSPNDEFEFLSEMMLNMTIGRGSQFDLPMQSSRGTFYPNYNINNSNIYGGYGRNEGKFPQGKSREEKRRRHQASRPEEESNWDEPHIAMKSQWMTSRPDNFESDYLTCVTPVAKRRIIVAARGKTCTYNKYGKLVDTFTSSLPSGAPHTMSGFNDLVVLDSFWCGSLQKFFVFDVMHWRQQPFYDAEAEFRVFWLADKIIDVKLKRSKKDQFPVEILPLVPSDKDSITNALENADYKIDGLLSYQRSSKYTLRDTKQALWLKLDMMEELLGYPPPSGAKYKPSTEKERKQRLHFISTNSEVPSPVKSKAPDNEEDDEDFGGEQHFRIDEFDD